MGRGRKKKKVSTPVKNVENPPSPPLSPKKEQLYPPLKPDTVLQVLEEGEIDFGEQPAPPVPQAAPKKTRIENPCYRDVSGASDYQVVSSNFRLTGPYVRYIEKTNEEKEDQVEYDLDSDDEQWLEHWKEEHKEEHQALTEDLVEKLIDRLEKISYKEKFWEMEENDQDVVCCICNDGYSEETNLLVYCDGCGIAVHQICYGVRFIPEGCWYCRRCEDPNPSSVQCELCPATDGAFKKTDEGKWAHVICGLFISETGFANDEKMEPIIGLDQIPKNRWKLNCSICNKKHGACIQCREKSCYKSLPRYLCTKEPLH